MDVRLLVARSKGEAKLLHLGPETLIGRSAECNLRIASGQVSRRHCLIKNGDAQVLVRDLGSANGTRLNGQTLSTDVDVAIAPGSTLVVGPLKFVVQFTPPKRKKDAESRKGRTKEAGASADDVHAMASAPVADGEDTKDYPPAKTRKRGAPPPLVVAAELAESDVPGTPPDDANDKTLQFHSTEVDLGVPTGDTVFDVALEDQNRAPVPGLHDTVDLFEPPPGMGTDLFPDDDQPAQSDAAPDGDTDETPFMNIESLAASDLPKPPASNPKKKPAGWGILKSLRGKKKPDASPPPSGGADDDELNKFLKDT